MRAFLFDLDGVLIDSFEMWLNLVNALARDHGYPAIPRARLEQAWGQGVEADVRTFFPRSTAAEVEAYYNARFLDHVEHLAVTPGAPETVRRLRERGSAACVITNTPTPVARELLARAGIAVDAVVGSSDVAAPKPAPDMIHRACALVSARTEEAAVVGDSRYDREAAAAAGVRFIGYRTDGDARIERLEELEEPPR